MKASADAGSLDRGFYVWAVPGKPVVVHLSFEAVDRLQVEIMRGFSAVPRRGAEVGGILLGAVEPGSPTVVRILDAEPVDCEHRRGPSYLLSDADREAFEEAVDRWMADAGRPLQAVGFYRSHTRDGLSLGPEDLALFDQYFPEAEDVALIVKPFATRVSVAGFFFREPEGIRSESTYLEFPFRRQELGGSAAPADSVVKPRGREAQTFPTPEPEPEAEMEAIPFPAVASDASSLFPAADSVAETARRKANIWIPLSFIFLLVGVLLGFQAALSIRPPADSSAGMDPYSLGLAASQSGENLHVRWDRAAPAIRDAQRGTLLISDGPSEKRVELDSRQLQNGSVIYRYVTPSVNFRLEVFGPTNNSIAESTRVQLPAADPALTAPASSVR